MALPRPVLPGKSIKFTLLDLLSTDDILLNRVIISINLKALDVVSGSFLFHVSGSSTSDSSPEWCFIFDFIYLFFAFLLRVSFADAILGVVFFLFLFCVIASEEASLSLLLSEV